MPLSGSSRSYHVAPHALHAIVLILLISILLAKAHASAQDPVDYQGLKTVRDLASGYGHLVERYVPEFLGLDRSIIGRAGDQIQTLANNAPGKLNINGGQSQYWSFPRTAIQGRKSPATPGLPSPLGQQNLSKRDNSEPALKQRQDQITIYISLNTCDQPTAKSSNTKGAPDQLKLYISTSSGNQKPDATKNDQVVPVDGGFGSINITANNDVYFGVSAPTNDGFTGSYNYELTASIDGFYSTYHDQTESYFVDSDGHSVLVYTNDTVGPAINSSNPLFHQWLNIQPPPFSIYVHAQENPAILGLQNSMCGLQNHAQIRTATDYDTSMTLAGGGQPKQQFHIKGLNASSAYYAIVGIKGNSTDAGGGVVHGGGTVWKPMNFTTKSGPNCALIYNLTFCSEVAYAVPSNATNTGDITALGNFYDSFAASSYVNFTKSLAQIPCNTSSSSQYSLAVNCGNCTRAYKQWLCAVTIPRCQDFSNTASYLQPRAVNYTFIDDTYGAQFKDDLSFSQENRSRLFMNSSRNTAIDTTIAPGPYKELLPCRDLCYGLVQSCPAALGFSCPLEGHGLNYTYGHLRDVGPGQASCNFPGADMNAATVFGNDMPLLMTVAILAIIVNMAR